jgi:glycosyltransferase involved in cell wall biosynthesis
MRLPDKETVAVAIYSHPGYYPPMLNAIDALAAHFRRVIVFSRNLGTGNWQYPANVKVHESGEHLEMKAAEKASFSWKIASFFRYCNDFYRMLQRDRPQWVLVNDPISLWALNRLTPYLGYRPKKWYHSHDITEMQGIRKYSVGYFAARSERRSFRELDLFTLPAADRLTFYPISGARAAHRVIPNYPRLSRMSLAPAPVWIKGEPLKIIYQGRVSDEHGLDELLACVAGDPGLAVTIIGPGDAGFISNLKKTVLEQRLSGRVKILDPVPYAELQAITAAHHVGWAVNEPVNLLYQTAGVASNKIYEYAASGLPIIYFRDQQYEKYLSRFSWAFSTDLGTKDIAEVLQRIKLDQPLQAVAARTAFTESLNYEIAFRDVLRLIG